MWPELGVSAGDGATYFGRLDDVTFGLPGIVAVGAILVFALLLAGWIKDLASRSRSDGTAFRGAGDTRVILPRLPPRDTPSMSRIASKTQHIEPS